MGRADLSNFVAGSFLYVSDKACQFVAGNQSFRNFVACALLRIVPPPLSVPLHFLQGSAADQLVRPALGSGRHGKLGNPSLDRNSRHKEFLERGANSSLSFPQYSSSHDSR